jgi:4-hydroxy-2-oxoheptanedioate aldolase
MPAADHPLATGRELKEALARGELRVGAFLKIPSPDMVEVLAGAGMQFVVADAEHGPIGPETCQHMARAAEASGIPLVVRIGETLVPATVNRFLDIGIAGVKLPRVSTVAEARRQLATLFHPPHGIRGLAGGRWARHGTAGALPDLVRELPRSLVVALQIEEVEALRNLERLLELEQPDVFFIGPTDLAASMGLRGDKGDPHVVDAVAAAIERIVAGGRTAGILAASPEDAAGYVRLGARYIAFNGESLAQAGARQALEATLGTAVA